LQVIKTAKDTKLVYFRIVGANAQDIKAFSDNVAKIKKHLPYDVEFLVGNENIELHSVKYLIRELYQIYKLEKKLQEDKEKISKKKDANDK